MTPSFTVPPEPQRFLSCAASASSSAPASGTPVTTVTPLPFLPWVCRPTRTTPSPAGRPAAFSQAQSATGCPQSGHIRPWPVEYTTPRNEPAARAFMNNLTT